ncbi:MAG: DUF433 domain-containing protein [Cryomorphaceae bacterium]|jgi:uncharacterized protein (DUF433 family)|nr:DUF433 domain-containing protein [Cryomorphaceae bacterium]
MDEKLLARITFEPDKCGGKPCIRGMRIRVSDILSLLANEMTIEAILLDFPEITKEDIQACLMYAASKIDHPVIKAA